MSIISSTLDSSKHTVKEIPHTTQGLSNALKETKCICGYIYIGHGGLGHWKPSRLIYDSGTTNPETGKLERGDSLCTHADRDNSGRHSYADLEYKNFI